jgi:dipeptidyl aminopeptidase/acylaminoacyl peptidase
VIVMGGILNVTTTLGLRFWAAATCALALMGPAAADAGTEADVGAAAPHAMTLDDMQKLLTVGAPVVSPDGAWVAYTVARVDLAADKTVSALWMASWDGQSDLQLTYGATSVSHPQWSPDGRWLSFIAAREGDAEGAAKGAQVWVLDRRGGEAHAVTDVKDILGDYRWSPDSRRLLLQLTAKDEPDPAPGAKAAPPKPIVIDRYHFKADVDGYLTDKRPHLYLYDLATKRLSKLTAGPDSGALAYGEEAGAWSPDGSQIAFVSNQAKPDPDRVANASVFVVAATPAAVPRRITTYSGEDQGPLAWTTDGKALLFREGVAAHYSAYDQPRLMIAPAAGGPARDLTARLDQWVGPPVPTGAGDQVLTWASDDLEQYVAAGPINGAEPFKRITTASGSALALSQGAGHVAVAWTTDLKPTEIYALEDGALRPITHHNDALVATLKLAPAQALSARTADGNDVHSLLTLPVDAPAGGKSPMLLRIHGGPVAQDAHGFSIERQVFAAKGYAVLNVNYRGSSGRGHRYSETINADWGDREVTDLLAAVDGAVATGKIDPARLGVGGWSYGGILTDAVIARTTRFKAASSGAGTAELLGFYGLDQYILQYDNELGPPWKDIRPYLKLSYPFLHADRIKTPTLFMGGDKDFNVPLAGGEQMYQALKSVGTPAELVVYPGQFHGFTRPSFIRDRYARWLGWYDLWVRGIRPEAPAGSPAVTP